MSERDSATADHAHDWARRGQPSRNHDSARLTFLLEGSWKDPSPNLRLGPPPQKAAPAPPSPRSVRDLCSLISRGTGPATHIVYAYIAFAVLFSFWMTASMQWKTGHLVGIGATAMAALFTFFAARFFNKSVRRGFVTVGSDGFHIHRRGLQSEYVSYEDVESIRAETSPKGGRVVVVDTRAGPQRLPLGNVVDEEKALAKTLKKRLSRAHKRYHRRDRAAVDVSLLDRNGRTIGAWRSELAKLRAGGYRQARIQDEALIELLEDDGAPRERRVAAALSLLDTDDPKKRARVDRARDVAAHPKLRIALEGVLDGTLEEATVEALAAEEADSAQRRELG